MTASAIFQSAVIPRIFRIRKCLAAVCFCFMLFSIACSRDNGADQYLIRVRDRQVSLIEFQQAVESSSEEAFPGERNIDPEALHQLRVQVLNQLTEELIILERGKELGISVSDAEINKALDTIKADYPDNTFDETLLENAVSFEVWKKKLAVRLTVEKVIAKELIDQVKLSQGDISKYYQDINKDKAADAIESQAQNEKMVLQLRRIKAEEAYQQWIDELRERYAVEINQKQWEKLTGVSS